VLKKEQKMQEDEPLMVLTKALALLAREYREIAGRIVTRHENNRYVLATDRKRLAFLNTKVDELGAALKAGVQDTQEKDT